MSYIPFRFEEFYPTPKDRISNPLPSVYQVGDIVKLLVGPASGKLGTVVVERNGNYKDYEPYSSDESIGVLVLEQEDKCQELEKLLTILCGSENLASKVPAVIRWADNPEQLELVMKRPTEGKTYKKN